MRKRLRLEGMSHFDDRHLAVIILSISHLNFRAGRYQYHYCYVNNNEARGNGGMNVRIHIGVGIQTG